MKPALLLIDFQNDFLRPGELEPHPAGVVAAATELLTACRRAGMPVIHAWTTVERGRDNRMPHWKRRGYWACMEGEPGHLCPPGLQPREDEPVVHKSFFSAFSTGQLDAILDARDIQLLLIAGVHLHGCVRATALDAYARGFGILMAREAIGSDDPLHGAITGRYLDDRAGAVCSCDEILPAIARHSLAQLFSRADATTIAHSSPQSPGSAWTMESAGQPEVDRAVAQAREAARTWAGVDPRERLERLVSVSRQLAQFREPLVESLVRDIGKPVRYARAEVARAGALIEAVCRNAQSNPQSVGPATGARCRRQPLGVIALVSPFNNPLAIPIGKIAPALAYGNVVLWKPAIPGSRLALQTCRMFQDSGLPEGALQALCGPPALARLIAARSDAVTLSGSRAAGWSMQELCATLHLPFQAELGGNNASIVWHDADLPAAAAKIAEGAFAFAGQRCTANRRAVVSEKVYDRFLGLLQETCAGLVWGEPADAGTHIGPLISRRQSERVARLLARTPWPQLSPPVSRGARGPDSGEGAWLAPTIVCCDDPMAEIVQEETFGPVLVVQKAGSWDEAMDLCNGVRQGLVAAVFTASQPLAADFLQRADAGVLKVNAATSDVGVDLPFGGWKASGIGPPEHGVANLEFFTRMQTIYEPSPG